LIRVMAVDDFPVDFGSVLIERPHFKRQIGFERFKKRILRENPELSDPQKYALLFFAFFRSQLDSF